MILGTDSVILGQKVLGPGKGQGRAILGLADGFLRNVVSVPLNRGGIQGAQIPSG